MSGVAKRVEREFPISAAPYVGFLKQLLGSLAKMIDLSKNGSFHGGISHRVYVDISFISVVVEDIYGIFSCLRRLNGSSSMTSNNGE